MRYATGTCKLCSAQTKHIPGGYVHSRTNQVHSKEGGYHEATPSFDKLGLRKVADAAR